MLRYGLAFVMALLPSSLWSCGQAVHCNVQCKIAEMYVSSSEPNLVSASGCGLTTQCQGTTPCLELTMSPPAQGGNCNVSVHFSDGTDIAVEVEWGAVHPSTSTCCPGPWYDNVPSITFGFPADAGAD